MPRELFKPGVSGNPKGRPKSADTSARLRAALLKEAPDVIAKLIENAKAGDAVAMKLYLDRVLPVLKPEAQRITMELPTGSFTDMARAAIAAATSGELPMDQASELIAAIGRLVPLAEHEELKRRLEELEKMK